MSAAIEFEVNLTVEVRSRNLVCASLKLVAFLTASCSVFALDQARSLDQFSYQTWQTGSGLPQNTVHEIVQTRDGYLWLATEGGLARFNAYQFTVFDSRNTPALKSDNVRALFEDPNRRLWIATAAGVLRRQGEHFETVTSNDGPERSTLAIYGDHSGGVWAVMPRGLTYWDAQQRLQTFFLDEGAPHLTGAAAVSSDSGILLGTQNGLASFQNGHFAKVATNLPQAAVNALLSDRTSRLWVGTAKGLFVIKTRDHQKLESRRMMSDGPVLSLFEDREGTIWVGSEKGLRRALNPSERALPEASVIAMAEDAEGDLWAGTESQGITIIRGQKFVTFTTREGLADDAVRCVFENSRGAISIGTNAGLTQLENGRAKQLTTATGLSSNVILSLGKDGDGNLLVGTPDGLNRVFAGRVSLTTSADGLADDFVRSIYRDNDGSLWIGTRRGLSHEDRANHFTTYTQAGGLGSDLVGEILRGPEGDLWIGTFNGLSRLHEGRFETYRVQDGLSSNIITALHADAAGDLWIGTQDAGLSVRHDGKIYHFSSKVGLPDAIFGIAEDADRGLWFASKAGIVRANRDELKQVAVGGNKQATIVWYGTSDGLRINECSVGGHPEVWKASNGTIWFSTERGAAALYASAAVPDRVPVPLLIESVAIDDQTFAPESVHQIGPGHSRFAFEYTGLSFVAPQKLIYRYKLEGFDKAWIDAGRQRIAYYTNIPPGRYRFRVIVRNNDGLWNDAGATLSFRLEPHFYQTAWFYGLAILGLIAAGYLVYRWRVMEVEARFNAVLQERNRIGREIHDTLAQGIVGVSVQLEIVSRLLSTSADTAREHLDQARVLVRESLAEARRSIWQLRSESTESEDLASRLSKSARQAVGLSPVKLSLEVRGTYRPLGRHVEDELLRIGQEAVMNALRHAHAERIDIELAYTSKKLCMTIVDDGCGFITDSVTPGINGHFGLKGMRERVEQISGSLVVDSAEGKGTRISVEAPLS